MARFWLGTCKVDPAVLPTELNAEPIVSQGASRLAIEVISDEQYFAVLFSAIDDLDRPQNLTCRIGFTNHADLCTQWRDRGFPLVDAAIECDGASVQVFSPYFADQQAMQYGGLLISIAGINFDADSTSRAPLTLCYEQFQESPDSAWPATYIRRRPVTWRPVRSKVTTLKPSGLWLDVQRTRCPSLKPLQPGQLNIASAWSGELDLQEPLKYLNPKEKPKRVSRTDTFGVPAFRFDDVEVLGFRIDLGEGRELEEGLAQLIKPLNFHLDQAADTKGSIPDFRYRPATHTVLIELLRYGRMKLKTQESPLTVLDYQSQHELVVRILVGRVDDDTAQAHAPAIYVPAIFVDNPWSKILGCDVQGFEKRMADFCIERDSEIVPLRPDGRLPGEAEPRQLADISRIELLDRSMNGRLTGDRTILELDCPPDRYQNWNEFQKVDLELALGSFSLGDTRWRQTDFDQTEFRRSFARAAVRETLKGFRSVQVTPVGDRGLEKTWITGTFTLDDNVRMVNPTGGTSLTFHAHRAAPNGWKQLCKLLGIGEGSDPTRSFQKGSWYRLQFSMSLTVDDGLEWSDSSA